MGNTEEPQQHVQCALTWNDGAQWGRLRIHDVDGRLSALSIIRLTSSMLRDITPPVHTDVGHDAGPRRIEFSLPVPPAPTVLLAGLTGVVR